MINIQERIVQKTVEGMLYREKIVQDSIVQRRLDKDML